MIANFQVQAIPPPPLDDVAVNNEPARRFPFNAAAGERYNGGMMKGNSMDILFFALMLVAWIVIQAVVLPRFGVST